MMTIEEHPGFETVDLVMLSSLIESAFKKRLDPDYFAYANPESIRIASIDGAYAGVIVVEPVLGKMKYLDKIAVAPAFQGNGIGKRLWDEVVKHNPKLVWRAHPENPVNASYLSRSHGTVRERGWNIYWTNLLASERGIGIAYAIAKRKTLL
jgi:acetylglutamate synthase